MHGRISWENPKYFQFRSNSIECYIKHPVWVLLSVDWFYVPTKKVVSVMMGSSCLYIRPVILVSLINNFQRNQSSLTKLGESIAHGNFDIISLKVKVSFKKSSVASVCCGSCYCILCLNIFVWHGYVYIYSLFLLFLFVCLLQIYLKVKCLYCIIYQFSTILKHIIKCFYFLCIILK